MAQAHIPTEIQGFQFDTITEPVSARPPRPGECIIPCPRCDTDVGDYSPEDRVKHLANCRGRWVQKADGSWCIVGAMAPPVIRYCHACAQVHQEPVNMDCRQGTMTGEI